MKKLALVTALLLATLLFATSPFAAQQRQQPLGAGGQTNTSSLPNTGVICQELMTATFCNVPTSPNTGVTDRAPGLHRQAPALPRRLRLFRSARNFRRPTNYATDQKASSAASRSRPACGPAGKVVQ